MQNSKKEQVSVTYNKIGLAKAFSPARKTKPKPKSVFTTSTLDTRKGPPVNVPDKVKRNNVLVFVRVRPLSQREVSSNCRNLIKIIDKSSFVFDPKESDEEFFFKGVVQKQRDINKKVNKDLLFNFNEVFDGTRTNQEVYNSTSKTVLKSIFDGYNCSVFAYGATGAGKTYTMLGTKDEPGITYLTLVDLLDHIESIRPAINVSVGLSYLEVYNENVKDLLYPSINTLHLREEPGGRVTVSGLQIAKISSADQLFSLLESGNKNRSQHPTDSNAESSRSHAVLQVHLRMESKDGTKLAKLSMIDLAGSERGAATGFKGLRFKEGSNINKSLLALGNCINALADGLNHVPYRDSKLTRILKDSLGGNCLTMMIANVSPSSTSFEDTYNTLKYADRTKAIKSQVKKNTVSDTVSSIPKLQKMIEELKEENERLKSGSLQVTDVKQRADNLLSIMNEKKKIHLEMLGLMSQEKLTEWRLKHKTAALSLYDKSIDSQSLDRLNLSINQLKARLQSVRSRLEECWPQLNENQRTLDSFMKTLQSSNVGDYLDDKISYLNCQLELSDMKMDLAHLSKFVRIQSRYEECQKNAVKAVYPVFSEFYKMLKGYGHLTADLMKKYEETMKIMNGVKEVTWENLDDSCDEDDDSTKERDYLRLSLSPLRRGPAGDGLKRKAEVRVAPFAATTLPSAPSSSVPSTVTASQANSTKRPKLNPTVVVKPRIRINKENIPDPKRIPTPKRPPIPQGSKSHVYLC